MATLRIDLLHSRLVIDSPTPLFVSPNGSGVYLYEIPCLFFELYDIWRDCTVPPMEITMRRRSAVFELFSTVHVSVIWGDCTYSTNSGHNVMFGTNEFQEEVDEVEYALIEVASYDLISLPPDYSEVSEYRDPSELVRLHHQSQDLFP